MRSLLLTLLLGAFSGVSLLQAQHKKLLIEKIPGWVDPVPFNKEAAPDPGQEAGFYCLLIDEQENVPQEESYTHIAYKVLTSEGVQSMSDLTFGFDPSYQTLKVHSARIHRGGQMIDKLPRTIQTIQREQSMDRYLYDGSLTAVINLTDVRIGDIIEYAFTRKGDNPVYEGHIGRKIYFSYNFAYDKLVQRLIVPAGRSLNLEYRNADVKPEIKTGRAGDEYVWSLKRKNALVSDDNVPDWYDGNQYVMITDHDSWGDVATWATRHFQVGKAELQALKKRLTETFETTDKRKFALDAIRFVQDDVRYLGFEAGLNSHKPHSPLKVFDQRFGDCKDKSLLLCTMLGSADIEAHPVLVNTLLRDKVENDVPSIMAFNHCVVQVKLDDEVFYIDPTINNQGGSLGNIAFPPYGKGLVIGGSTPSLQDLHSQAESKITETQTIGIPTLDGEAYLQVTTTYTGGEADYVRSEFQNNNAEAIQKNYLTFYGNLYPDIETINPIAHKDNRRDNIFTVEEYYKIPTFWQPSEEDEDILLAEMYPQTLSGYFNVTKSSQRTTPYRLQYPLSYQHSFNIKLPEEWTVENDEKYVDNDYYHYEYYVRNTGKEITVERHYRTKRDHIPLEAFPQFVSDHEEVFNSLTFQLSFNKNMVSNAEGVSWVGVISALLALGAGLWMALHLYYYYDPKPAVDVPDSGQPIGGWLILVGIGLAISPLRIIYDLFNLPEAYDNQVWANFIALNRYDLFAVMLITHVYNIVFLAYAILVLILFIQRRSSLPRLITIYLAVNCFMMIADSLIAAGVDPTAADQPGYFRDMFSAVVGAAIWIPYFNMSSRVKETFVVRVNDDNDDMEYSQVGYGSDPEETSQRY